MAVPGTMGRIVRVDLATQKLTVETPSDDVYLKYLGGYGIGAHYLYNEQKPGVDPLGPESLLGVFTGVLTGTPGISTNRYTVVAKSPKTGTWGDANSGGELGPAMKHAGFDGVLFSGISDKPVYLLLKDGEATAPAGRRLVGQGLRLHRRPGQGALRLESPGVLHRAGRRADVALGVRDQRSRPGGGPQRPGGGDGLEAAQGDRLRRRRRDHHGPARS